jgi:hypothetical protein
MHSIRKALWYFIACVLQTKGTSLFVFVFWMSTSQQTGFFEEDKPKVKSPTNHWPAAAESSLNS